MHMGQPNFMKSTMRFVIAFFCFLIPLLKATCQVANDYELVWSDEFDYTGLPDASKWGYDVGDACPDLCGWGNNELQYYTQKSLQNARVENGLLHIEVHKEKTGNRNYTSARLVTKGKGEWKYGRFEIRAKLPDPVRGAWSAIWMMPVDSSIYGKWPKSGEIDIMENVGFDPDTVVAAAHTGSYYFTIGTQKEGRQYVGNSSDEFHLYALEWDEKQYKVFVDDVNFFTFPNEDKGFMSWPFDQRFYLILNIAFGGNWGAAKGVDDSLLPVKMQVDYVRVYQKTGI